MEDTENERPQQCYNFHGIRDFFKKYKSKLQNVSHRDCDRRRHLNRSRSFVSPCNVKDQARLDNFKADNDKNKDKNGEKELNKKSQKHTNYGNHIMNSNNHHNINNGCFKTIILPNAPKKKQAPSKISASDLSDDNFASIEKEEKVTPSRATSFEAKPSLGRSTTINNGTKSQQQGAKTPNNSRATSMNRTFSIRSRTNSFNNGGVNSNTNAPPRYVNRSTSMNMSRSTSNSGNVVMSSFRSFNKSKSGHIIMFSNSSGILKPPAMELELECTLEELCHGCVKKIRVSRDVYSSTGKITQEEEVLTVNIKPGWKAGTKITFPGTTTNDMLGEYRADVIFILTEMPHRLFRRDGDDLEMEMEIPLVDALGGCTLTILLLEGEKMTMTIDDVVYPRYEKVLIGRGMPNQKNSHQKGNLKIKFLVDFPKNLTKEQQSGIFNIFSDVNFES